MKTVITNNFIVDKETNTVKVTREFAAKKDLVWKTWTEPELLDQWWAPKPYISITKSMDFTEGGRRIYAMAGPNGEEHWALANYTSINPEDQFAYTDGFCDSEGNKSDFLPGSEWTVIFSESEGKTTVHVEIKHQSLEDLEKIIELGFREGFTVGLNQLEELLNQKKL